MFARLKLYRAFGNKHTEEVLQALQLQNNNKVRKGTVKYFLSPEVNVPQGSTFKSALEGEQLLMGFNGPKLISVGLRTSEPTKGSNIATSDETTVEDKIISGKFGRFRLQPGTVTNFEGSRIQEVEQDSLSTSLAGTIPPPKVGSKVRSASQISTGNIPIDLTQPIGEGSLVLFNGKKGSGRSTTVSQTVAAFLDSNATGVVVYISVSPKEAKTFLSTLKTKERCFVVCPEAAGSDTSIFINTEAAIRTAIDLKNQGRQVLCVVEDLNLVLAAGLAVAKDLGTYYLTRNFIYALMDHSYCFKNGSSLTTILVSEEPALDNPYFMSLLGYHNLIKSASKNIVQFGTSNSVPVGADLQLLPSPYGFQIPYMRTLTQRLFGLLMKLKAQKNEINQFKSLGLHIDPWDHYLYFDSLYFTKLLLHKTPLSVHQQMVLVHFVLRSIETDSVGYMQAEPESLIRDLVSAAEKPLASGVSVIETLRLSAGEPDCTHIDSLLDAFFDIFFEQQRAEGKLRPDKNDYL